MLFFLSSSSFSHCLHTQTQTHSLSISRPMCTQMKRRLHFFYYTIHSSLWLFSHFLLRRMSRSTYNGVEWCALVYFEIWFSHFVHHIFFFLLGSVSVLLYLYPSANEVNKGGGKKGWHIRMSLSLFTETWITIRWCILAGCSSCCVHHSAVISQLALAFFSSLPRCVFIHVNTYFSYLIWKFAESPVGISQ